MPLYDFTCTNPDCDVVDTVSLVCGVDDRNEPQACTHCGKPMVRATFNRLSAITVVGGCKGDRHAAPHKRTTR